MGGRTAESPSISDPRPGRQVDRAAPGVTTARQVQEGCSPKRIPASGESWRASRAEQSRAEPPEAAATNDGSVRYRGRVHISGRGEEHSTQRRDRAPWCATVVHSEHCKNTRWGDSSVFLAARTHARLLAGRARAFRASGSKTPSAARPPAPAGSLPLLDSARRGRARVRDHADEMPSRAAL
jgi:hypothetical protein